MKTVLFRTAIKIQNVIYDIVSDKRTMLILMIMIVNVTLTLAQNTDDTGIANSLYSKVSTVYRIMSVIVILGLLYFGGKAGLEGMRGEQGAWMKFGAILAIGGIWFFAIPPFISYLNKQTATF